MEVRCMKQVDCDDEIYFLEGVRYQTHTWGSDLYAIDEMEDKHTIAEDEDYQWDNDDWFYEHFRII